MTLWERFMRLFGVQPTREPPPRSDAHTAEGDDLADRITAALENQKQATGEIVNSSLNQVQRAEDVKLVIGTLKRKLEWEDRNLRNAQAALDFISARERPH